MHDLACAMLHVYFQFWLVSANSFIDLCHGLLQTLFLLLTFYGTCSGEATRKGFYIYDDKRKASPDPEIKKYIEKSRSMAGSAPDPEVLLFPYMIN